MNIGLSDSILLIGALTASLFIMLFIIVGMLWLNRQVEALHRQYSEMMVTLQEHSQCIERLSK